MENEAKHVTSMEVKLIPNVEQVEEMATLTSQKTEQENPCRASNTLRFILENGGEEAVWASGNPQQQLAFLYKSSRECALDVVDMSDRIDKLKHSNDLMVQMVDRVTQSISFILANQQKIDHKIDSFMKNFEENISARKSIACRDPWGQRPAVNNDEMDTQEARAEFGVLKNDEKPKEEKGEISQHKLDWAREMQEALANKEPECSKNLPKVPFPDTPLFDPFTGKPVASWKLSEFEQFQQRRALAIRKNEEGAPRESEMPKIDDGPKIQPIRASSNERFQESTWPRSQHEAYLQAQFRHEFPPICFEAGSGNRPNDYPTYACRMCKHGFHWESLCPEVNALRRLKEAFPREMLCVMCNFPICDPEYHSGGECLAKPAKCSRCQTKNPDHHLSVCIGSGAAYAERWLNMKNHQGQTWRDTIKAYGLALEEREMFRKAQGVSEKWCYPLHPRPPPEPSQPYGRALQSQATSAPRGTSRGSYRGGNSYHPYQ